MSLTITGKAYYSFHNKPNKDNRYKITVAGLSDEDRAKLKKIGVKPKFVADEDDVKHEWGWYVEANNYKKPKSVDAKKKTLPENLLIGNGSKVKVTVSPYEGKGDVKKVYLNFNALQLLELVPYVPKSRGGEVPDSVLDSFDEEDGFDASELEAPFEEDEKKTTSKKTTSKKSSKKEEVQEDFFDDELDL